jgi:hypothetical protein
MTNETTAVTTLEKYLKSALSNVETAIREIYAAEKTLEKIEPKPISLLTKVLLIKNILTEEVHEDITDYLGIDPYYPSI